MPEDIARKLVRWSIPGGDGGCVTVIFPANLGGGDVEVLALVLRAYIARRDKDGVPTFDDGRDGCDA